MEKHFQSGKANVLKLLNTSSPSQHSNNNIPQRTTQKVHFQDDKLSKPQAANMTQFDKFISLYHTFYKGNDNNTKEDQVNKDELNTDAENSEGEDQLYSMLKTSTKIEQSKQKPGNINHLLPKAHSKG